MYKQRHALLTRTAVIIVAFRLIVATTVADNASGEEEDSSRSRRLLSLEDIQKWSGFAGATGGDAVSSSTRKATDATDDAIIIGNDSVVNCPALVQQVHRGLRPDDPNQGHLYARYTKLQPQFWVSLHTFDYDKVRYGTLHWGKYYEKALSKAFTEVLTEFDPDKNALVIDVGGNIGWFSLLSAAMGYEVHAFEPNIINVMRFCESSCMNGWGRDCPTMGAMYIGTTDDETNNNNKHYGNIKIRTLGLSDEAGDFWLRQSAGSFSSGAGQITNTGPAGNATRVQVVTLDEMATKLNWLDRDVAILKVDVEGLEHEVFRGGEKFLQSKRIFNIFMEANLRSQLEEEKFLQLVDRFETAGYYVHQFGGSMGPANGIDKLPHPRDDPKFIEGLLWACRGFEKQNRSQCNIWWKLKEGTQR